MLTVRAPGQDQPRRLTLYVPIRRETGFENQAAGHSASHRLSTDVRLQLPDAWSNLRFDRDQRGNGENTGQAAILFVMQGEIEISVDHFRHRAVCSGQMCLIPPSATFTFRAVEETRLAICCFAIESIPFDQYSMGDLYTACEKILYEFNVLPMGGLLFDLLRQLENYIQAGIDSPAFLNLKQQEMFHLFFALYTEPELAGFFHPLIGEDLEFKNLVHNNWNVKNIQELAALTSLSTSGFIKKFTRHFKESPYKWIMQQKALRIRRDIQAGVLPLKQIAIKYNFLSYQHFAGFCKSQFGMPPSQLAGFKSFPQAPRSKKKTVKEAVEKMK